MYNTYLTYVLYFDCSPLISRTQILIKVMFLCRQSLCSTTSKIFPVCSTDLGIVHFHCKTGILCSNIYMLCLLMTKLCDQMTGSGPRYHSRAHFMTLGIAELHRFPHIKYMDKTWKMLYFSGWM